METTVPTEPVELKAWMQALRQSQLKDPSVDWDPYVVWAGNKLPKYLWDSWKEELKPAGFTWQRFMRLLRYRTDLGVMWYRDAIPWQSFVEKVRELIDGPLGRTLLKRPTKTVIQAQTISVPIVGMIAAGTPAFAEENIEGYVEVSTDLAKLGFKYFVLRVVGDSMDQVNLKNGDYALVRQQSGAEEGDNVVALINDEATVKEFHREKGIVVLRPRSTKKDYKPIVLTEDFQIQGVVVTSIPSPVLESIK